MTPKLRERTVSSPAPSVQNGFSLISNEKLLQLYAAMLKCRMIADRTRILAQQNHFSGRQASLGQEAAMVGLAMDLLPGDHIATNPGNVVPFFIKGSQTQGFSLESLLSALLKSSAQKPDSANHFKSATKAAKANKQAKNKDIAVALCGATAPFDSWREALNVATLKDLPLIFLSWNHVPLKKNEYGLPAINVDGNDVVAVYRVASEAIAHARIGNGPTLIECRTDDHNSGDPILNMEKYLGRKGLFREEFKSNVETLFAGELDVAMTAAKPKG
jgi:TPP-dependent pyruvate/acetoin dehydrogenase alpha subunit